MESKNENLPIITIDLKPDLHDFLIHEFGEDEHGCIKLHKRNELGKYIDSMWCVSEFPVKRKFEKYNNPVKLILPICADSAYIVKYNFLYFSSCREQQINDHIESIWKLVVREYFVTGYEKKFKQSVIIEGILKAFNIKKNVISFDRIKKMDYRIRENNLNSVVREIKSAIVQ